MNKEAEYSQYDVMLASSYNREPHLSQVFEAAKIISEKGYSVYPPSHAEPVQLSSGFVYMSNVDKIGTSRPKLERTFLEGIKKSRLTYVINPNENGYIGQSTSSEIAYSFAVETPVLISRPITSFGKSVNENIQRLILENHPTVIDIEEIKNAKNLEDIIKLAKKPLLTAKEKKDVILSFFGIASSWEIKAPQSYQSK